MSTEVKMVYADVESQLDEMRSATNALDPKAEAPITGNTMDVVTKLTEQLIKLEGLLIRDQKLLLDNNNTTRNSVEFMRKSDEKISSAIESAAPGPRRLMS